MWVESEVGRGSTFHVTFPAAPAPSAELDARPSRSMPPDDPAPLRLLLAEDDATCRKVAEEMLKNLGYRPDMARNGLEVLAALDRRPYDAVLLDVQMPELDGLETARRIRQRWPAGTGPRLVAVTAHALAGDRERCLAAGMDDYVKKPLTFKGLQQALERCRSASDVAEPVIEAPAAEHAAGADAVVLDRPSIEELRQIGGGGTLRRVVGVFLRITPQRLTDIQDALGEGDAHIAANLAHGLKTAAGTLGGMKMMALAEELERVAESGDVSEASALLSQVEEQFAHLRPKLESELTSGLS